MQDANRLEESHFGVRLQQRFQTTFTPSVRRELFEAIKTKKAELVGSAKDVTRETLYYFKYSFRGKLMIFVVARDGNFVTCFPR